MSDELEIKIHIIFFKRTILDAPSQVIIESCETKEEYKIFLAALNNTLKQEPSFFLLKEQLIDTAENVLYANRFRYKDEEIISLINEIIIGFNRLKNIDNKTKKDSLKAYVQEQSEKRECYIPNREILHFMMSNDASLMEAMLLGKTISWQPGYFINSTNYFVNTMPEFFEEYEYLTQQTINNLHKITDNKKTINFLTRTQAENSIKKLQKVKTKEE